MERQIKVNGICCVNLLGITLRHDRMKQNVFCTGFVMIRTAKYTIGQVVRHRIYPFRGVVFDIDPEFGNTEEWYSSIPEEVRPIKDQPFYHLFAENDESEYVAYVSEQNLLADDTGEPVSHPQVDEVVVRGLDGNYTARQSRHH